MLLELLFVCAMAPSPWGGLITNSLGNKCQLLLCPPAPGGCQVDLIKDLQGCPVTCDYTCGAPWCRLRPCNLICHHGYMEDAMGCSMCQCQCSDTWCQSDCPSGYMKDSNNCPTCACLPQPRGCSLWSACQFGFCPDSCKCQPDCFDAYPLPDNPQTLAL
ncbi:unnamed protein product [Candidula unifasciata]|uniref:Antistasin-like domain-containing protein n=1 Tax=Candidula unifasciata TaxID=100452 RepID=A0A8S3Z0D5_9EUPU|nr:unnamed protein product [Candidula unifasciata]